MRDGRERWFGIGPLRLVGLGASAASVLARSNEKNRWHRPIEDKKAAKAARALAAAKALTFREATQRYLDQHEGKWKNAKHSAQFLSSLTTYAFPSSATLPVADIDTPAGAARAIEPIGRSRPKPPSRVRGRIENVLDWATVRGYRTGDNPARWKGHLARCCQRADRLPRSNTTPPCPTPSCRPSWPSCAHAKVGCSRARVHDPDRRQDR